jgi:sulfonate transport system permease protein
MSFVAMTVTADQGNIDAVAASPATGRSGSLRFLRPALGLILPVGLAVAWELIVRLSATGGQGLPSWLWKALTWLGPPDGRLLPPPSVIYATFVELAKTGELQRHAAATLARVGAGFGLGVAAGTFLGAVTGYSSLARRILDPTFQGLRAIPSIAWVPLFILWLGIFEESKVTLIAVGVFFPVYLGVMAAIHSVDRKLVEVGRAFRLSGAAMVRRILLPAVLPSYVVALRSGLGLGWMFVVAAEFMGASEGLGFLLVDGQQLGKPAQIVAAIVAFAIIGKTTDWMIAAAAAPFLRWEDVVVRE